MIHLLSKGLVHRSSWIICVESHEWMTVEYALQFKEFSDLQQIHATLSKEQ